jgi:hypothetical protein
VEDTSDQETADRTGDRKWPPWYEITNLILSIEWITVTIWVACIYSRQLKVMQGQLDEMKNSSRTVAISPVG